MSHSKPYGSIAHAWKGKGVSGSHTPGTPQGVAMMFLSFAEELAIREDGALNEVIEEVGTSTS